MTTSTTGQPTGAAKVRRQVSQQGTVTSVSGRQSVVVQIDRRILHPRYGKYISKRSKFMAHDEASACAVGDVVEIVACRPLSARKRWRVRRVVEKAGAGFVQEGPLVPEVGGLTP